MNVLVEIMPDYLRQSHRDARNWGSWPHNGSLRKAMPLEQARITIASDPDDYARVVAEYSVQLVKADGECDWVDVLGPQPVDAVRNARERLPRFHAVSVHVYPLGAWRDRATINVKPLWSEHT